MWTHPYIKFVICALFCCVSRTLIIWCALAARRIASRSLEDPEATAFLWAHEADDLASCGRRTLRALRTRAGKREDKMRPSGPFRGNYCTMRYHVSHARRANRRSILQCKKKKARGFPGNERGRNRARGTNGRIHIDTTRSSLRCMAFSQKKNLIAITVGHNVSFLSSLWAPGWSQGNRETVFHQHDR